jgi:hypothetical protein
MLCGANTPDPREQRTFQEQALDSEGIGTCAQSESMGLLTASKLIVDYQMLIAASEEDEDHFVHVKHVFSLFWTFNFFNQKGNPGWT